MDILITGHSHIKALMLAQEDAGNEGDVQVSFLSFRDEEFSVKGKPPRKPNMVRIDLLLREFAARAQSVDAIVLCLNGNEHNNIGMFESFGTSTAEVEARIASDAAENYTDWLNVLLRHCGVRTVVLLPPPPIESEAFILGTNKVKKFGRPLKVRNAQDRLNLWRRQCEITRDVALAFGLEVVSLPTNVFSSNGFLAEDCPRGATHGNSIYGKRVLDALVSHLASSAPSGHSAGRTNDGRKHPYRMLPNYCFWKQSVSQVASSVIDPVVAPSFKIRPRDKVATAGSCFAQHISKHLRAGGFKFLITESAKAGEGEEGSAYHDFSARYGNVYTARQLLQLFDRAFGYYRPQERVWKTSDGRFCDPFRPTTQPGGYPTKEAVIEDTQQHLIAVRKMFRQLDVFVFTLGLTECWTSRLDGAVYPMAPGVAGGEYDPKRHAFVNFGVGEVVSDMQLFIKKLRVVNPKAKVILTVSPVPLAATYEDRHVLVSTTYSKSVLRVAAEELVATNEGVYYFPSYEIITGSHAAGGYFEEDRRGVTFEGVNHVMRVFMERLTEEAPSRRSDADDELEAQIEAMGEAMCDEAMLER